MLTFQTILGSASILWITVYFAPVTWPYHPVSGSILSAATLHGGGAYLVNCLHLIKLKELSDARATMQSQRAEVDKWKIEAEKSNAKERAARRALECARVAAGDAARRFVTS